MLAVTVLYCELVGTLSPVSARMSPPTHTMTTVFGGHEYFSKKLVSGVCVFLANRRHPTVLLISSSNASGTGSSHSWSSVAVAVVSIFWAGKLNVCVHPIEMQWHSF